jgi:hypothetical protein
MKFLIGKPQEDQNFSLVYQSYYFDTEPRATGDYDRSILINYLELELDEMGRTICIGGYQPLTKYEETDEAPTNYQAQSLVVVLGEPAVPGVLHRLNKDAMWPIYINKKKGWVCLGNPKTDDKQLIEFAPGCVATIEGQELIALWLHPKKLPEF